MAGIAAHLWSTGALEAIQSEDFPRKIAETSRRRRDYERLSQTTRIENYKTTIFPYMKGTSARGLIWRHVLPDWFYMQGAVKFSRHYAAWHQAARPIVANETWPAGIQELNQDGFKFQVEPRLRESVSKERRG